MKTMHVSMNRKLRLMNSSLWVPSEAVCDPPHHTGMAKIPVRTGARPPCHQKNKKIKNFSHLQPPGAAPAGCNPMLGYLSATCYGAVQGACAHTHTAHQER